MSSRRRQGARARPRRSLASWDLVTGAREPLVSWQQGLGVGDAVAGWPAPARARPEVDARAARPRWQAAARARGPSRDDQPRRVEPRRQDGVFVVVRRHAAQVGPRDRQEHVARRRRCAGARLRGRRRQSDRGAGRRRGDDDLPRWSRGDARHRPGVVRDRRPQFDRRARSPDDPALRPRPRDLRRQAARRPADRWQRDRAARGVARWRARSRAR